MSFGPAADVSFSGLPLKLVEQRRSKSRNKASLQTPDKASSAKPERVKSTVSLRKVNLSSSRGSSVKKGLVLTARLPEQLTSIVSSQGGSPLRKKKKAQSKEGSPCSPQRMVKQVTVPVPSYVVNLAKVRQLENQGPELFDGVKRLQEGSKENIEKILKLEASVT